MTVIAATTGAKNHATIRSPTFIATKYLNNPKEIVKISVNVTSSADDYDDEIAAPQYYESIQEITKILCPFLFDDDIDGRVNNAVTHSSGGCMELEIKPLSGGLSNHIFLVTKRIHAAAASSSEQKPRLKTSKSRSVLFRIYPHVNHNSVGANVDNVSRISSKLDRDQEIKFSSFLAERSMGPTIYGNFENGRVEEFYENTKPIAWKEMKVYAPWVSRKMASFHLLETPPNDVLPKPTTMTTKITGHHDDDSSFSTTMYENISGYFNIANRSINDDALLKELNQEWSWLQNELNRIPPSSYFCSSTSVERCISSSISHDDHRLDVVVHEALRSIRKISVTHMDCQPLNILIDDYGDDNITHNDEENNYVTPLEAIKLIDFEYSGWNFIAADIANTFCEYCEMSNLKADYRKEYPSLQHQDVFFWNYLEQFDPSRAKTFISYPRRHEQLWRSYNHKEPSMDANTPTTINSPISNENCDDDDDDEWKIFMTICSQEVGRFTLLSHLGWSIWAVVKSHERDADFDFRFYARHRMDGYRWAKKQFFPM